MQSRRMSLAEMLANTGSGMVVSWLIGLVVYPMFGFAVQAGHPAASRTWPQTHAVADPWQA
ncbi:hypothetical protein [uncultured Methylobacterium sp.]|uniref:DUF7220 family protein n=1 Tax=uncultured Methylobacterium sp. TaxID=157278 RepID=UPI0035CA53E8